MDNKPLLLLLSLLISITTFSQQKSLDAITIENSQAYMKYLSSDAIQGRRTGSDGNLDAAAYIVNQAEKAGLRPLPGREDMYQTLKFLKTSVVEDSTALILRDTLGNEICKINVEPLMTPASTVDLSGEIAYAGYGYMNSKTRYSDYQGISFKDKVVIVMTRKPDLAGSGMPRENEKINEDLEMRKLTPLLMQGPKAILFVADPAYDDSFNSGSFRMGDTYKLTPLFKSSSFNFALNICIISPEDADRLLAPAGTNLIELQNNISETKKPVSFIVPGEVADLTIKVKQDTVYSSNVVGYIEGSDPALKEECVIYSAHYDHVGVKKDGSVNNGANDNASGTVGLLNIAKAFSVLEKKPLRSIVFLWTTGEEEGLYGSGYYISNPLFPLDKTVADLNFDMIGRSWMPADTGKVMGQKLDINGRDTIKIISARDCMEIIDYAIASGNETGLKVIDEGRGSHFSGSDHYNFVLKGIPAVFFFTGLHSDYHSITDDYEFIDFDKLVKTSRTGFLTGLKIANNPERPVVKKPGVK